MRVKLGPFYNIVKVFRYVMLFGVSRTLIKIRIKLFLESLEKQNRFGTEGRCRGDSEKNGYGENYKGRLAIIGCGTFGLTTVAYFALKRSKYSIKYFVDMDIAKAEFAHRLFGCGKPTVDLNEVLDDEDITLCFIATNHSTHAELACKVLGKNKSVHIEKPHVISETGLSKLEEAMAHSQGSVFLGYNRRRALFSKVLKERIDSVDDENMSLSGSWFVLGHQLSGDHWYNADGEGSRVLGNLVHWIDWCWFLVSNKDLKYVDICPIFSTTHENVSSVGLSFDSKYFFTICFSALGETPTGVFESFRFQYGDCFGEIENFQKLVMVTPWQSVRKTRLTRDLGHKSNIINSIRSVDEGKSGCSVTEVVVNGRLILGVADACKAKKNIRVSLI